MSKLKFPTKEQLEEWKNKYSKVGIGYVLLDATWKQVTNRDLAVACAILKGIDIEKYIQFKEEYIRDTKEVDSRDEKEKFLKLFHKKIVDECLLWLYVDEEKILSTLNPYERKFFEERKKYTNLAGYIMYGVTRHGIYYDYNLDFYVPKPPQNHFYSSSIDIERDFYDESNDYTDLIEYTQNHD
jgi:hypothetical protein